MLRLVIVNPMAGKSKGEKYAKAIEKIFLNIKKEGKILEDEVKIELTKGIGDATNIVNRYKSSKNLSIAGNSASVSPYSYFILFFNISL